MAEEVKVSEEKTNVKKNILGIISLVLSSVGLVGSWIPILNVVSILLAAAGIVLGIISIVMVCLKKAGMIALPILGLVFGAITIALGTVVNNVVIDASKNISTNSAQPTTTTTTQDSTNKSDNSSSGSNNSTTQGNNSQNSTKNDNTQNSTNTQGNATTQNKVYGVSDIISWDGKQIIVTDTVRNYKAKYAKPKSGKEFIKVTISIVNKSDKDMLVSPMKFKVQDSTGAQVYMESCTYSLADPFQSATLAPGGSRQGSIVFEVNKNDTDMKLICTASTALPADALEIKL